jgi:hypothetical protein
MVCRICLVCPIFRAVSGILNFDICVVVSRLWEPLLLALKFSLGHFCPNVRRILVLPSRRPSIVHIQPYSPLCCFTDTFSAQTRRVGILGTTLLIIPGQYNPARSNHAGPPNPHDHSFSCIWDEFTNCPNAIAAHGLNPQPETDLGLLASFLLVIHALGPAQQEEKNRRLKGLECEMEEQ